MREYLNMPLRSFAQLIAHQPHSFKSPAQVSSEMRPNLYH
jgi:hypothetical protein